MIDTITSKAVLILGRFTDERKAVLDAFREGLRKRNYLPILFDFEKPTRDTRDGLAAGPHGPLHRCRYHDASSVPQELGAIVPDLPVPVQPITRDSGGPWYVRLPEHAWCLQSAATPGRSRCSLLGEKVIAPQNSRC